MVRKPVPGYMDEDSDEDFVQDSKPPPVAKAKKKKPGNKTSTQQTITAVVGGFLEDLYCF